MTLFDYINENNIAFDEMKNGIIIVDTDGRVKYINTRALELLDLTSEYAMERYILEVYAESELERIIKTEVAEKEVRIIVRNHICITSRIPLYVNGVLMGAIAIFDDITKYENLNLRLEAERSEMAILKTVLEYISFRDKCGSKFQSSVYLNNMK